MIDTRHRSQDRVVLATAVEGLDRFLRGKVRDVYDLDYELLIVATDRISAYDVVLPTGIPDKGRVLNQLSAFWFRETKNICPSHFITIDLGQIAVALRALGVQAAEKVLSGRSMLVNKTRALPVECVVRGYLEGSAWKEYQQYGTVCGIDLPGGLLQGSRLPEPIFTPATKETSGHDVNIPLAQLARRVEPGLLRQMVDLSLAVYTYAHAFALERGIIVADTKFEFGVIEETVVMIDECLTPDSSRFWQASNHRPGGAQYSLDKQFVRDYLDSSGWDHEPPAPDLPEHVVLQTSERYREIFTRLTGMQLE
jgi:phosphoribosylaminoimidazole-succinocarboxamide synthase